MLRLFLGNHLEALGTEIAYNDDACSYQSRIEAILQPGYYTVVVAGFDGSEGPYRLAVSCGSWGDLSCGSTFTGDTTGAVHVVGTDSGEHYYRLTVTTTQQYTFSTCDGSDYDTWLRLYAGDHLDASSSSELASVDDACQTRSRIVDVLEPGAYTIVVEGYDSNEGTYTLQTTCIPYIDAPQCAAPASSAMTAITELLQETVGSLLTGDAIDGSARNDANTQIQTVRIIQFVLMLHDPPPSPEMAPSLLEVDPGLDRAFLFPFNFGKSS